MRDLMSKYCTEGAFAPETVRLLADAFDAAWASVEARGTMFATSDEAHSAREILATHIIRAAQRGERDRRKLSDGALVQLAKKLPIAIVVR
jgi:hypothetical protein